jgi:predicted amino acid racemase
MRITVNCSRLQRNTESIVKLCAPHGIELVGVTKACCGHPDVARAILDGGANKLGESRLSNIRRLRKGGIEAEIMLLRLPAMSEADEVVKLTQISLNSQVETVQALSQAATEQGVTHRVILMVESGDRREGIMPERALEVARAVAALPNIDLMGMGTNTTCIGGVLPTRENTQALVEVAEMVENRLGVHFKTISAGNSASLALLLRDEMPPRANQLRVGGAIMIGEVDSTGDWPDALPHQDAFSVTGEVIEVETKPSAPEGLLAPNAFGEIPQWPDMGLRRRAIIALGRQDLAVENLVPKRPGVTILGASSDHLVLDVMDASPSVRIGEELEFRPLYGAVATAMSSAVTTQCIQKGSSLPIDD